MFDIGFWEICIIGIIALVVVGPERFPSLVRSVGYWFGRAKDMAGSVKYELEKEVEKADKLKELMDQQVDLEEKYKKMVEEVPNPEDRKPVPVTAKVKENSILNEDAKPSEPKVAEKTDSSQEPAKQEKTS